jgi:drug/metabolite transporter (DMT)-like permease
MILVIVLYAALASTFVIAKQVVALAKPFFIIGFRMMLAGSLLTGYVYIKNRASFSINREDYWLFGKVALFHIYLAFVPEFWSLQYVSSIKTNLMYSATPFIAAFLSFMLLGERLNPQKWIGMLLGICSLMPLFLLQQELALIDGVWLSLPDVVLFGAVCSASYAWFLVKKLMDKGYQLPLINGLAMLGGGLGALLTSLFFEGVAESPIYDFLPFLKYIFLLILVANILVYNLYGYLLQRYSITFVALSGLLCPIFGALFGWFFLHEALSWNHLFSLVGLSVALYIFQTANARADQ